MNIPSSNIKNSSPLKARYPQLKKSRISDMGTLMGLFAILLTASSIIGCNGNNSNSSSKKTDSTAQSNVQGNDDGTKKVYQGMELIKSGNEMVNKGEKANDRAMINQGISTMDKGMEMVKSGRMGNDSRQHENEGMDDKMAKGDSAKTIRAKNMDMGDSGMEIIHQGIDVAKSGKMLTIHAQKDKDKPMMQTGMDMMTKGMAMITMGKEMMGKDSPAMSGKPMADDMDMMDKGMDMMDKGKGMAAKAMGPADKPMMDDDMDKGMDMMDKGMDMMGMGADKMKKDKKTTPKKDAPMTDM
ncbi:MAG: hypothetical protein V4456_01415 [Bacteroidota bacterium]